MHITRVHTFATFKNEGSHPIEVIEEVECNKKKNDQFHWFPNALITGMLIDAKLFFFSFGESIDKQPNPH